MFKDSCLIQISLMELGIEYMKVVRTIIDLGVNIDESFHLLTRLFSTESNFFYTIGLTMTILYVTYIGMYLWLTCYVKGPSYMQML